MQRDRRPGRRIERNRAGLRMHLSEPVEIIEDGLGDAVDGLLVGALAGEDRRRVVDHGDRRILAVVGAGRDLVDLVVGIDRKSTSELQSLMRIQYAVFCLKKKTKLNHTQIKHILITYNSHISNTNTL